MSSVKRVIALGLVIAAVFGMLGSDYSLADDGCEGVSDSEKEAYDFFVETVEEYRLILGDERTDSYIEEAWRVFSNVVFDDDSCNELINSINYYGDEIKMANVSTKDGLIAFVPEIIYAADDFAYRNGLRLLAQNDGKVLVDTSNPGKTPYIPKTALVNDDRDYGVCEEAVSTERLVFENELEKETEFKDDCLIIELVLKRMLFRFYPRQCLHNWIRKT